MSTRHRPAYYNSSMVQATNEILAERTAVEIKANGIHYTPSELAQFLAQSLVAAFLSEPGIQTKSLTVLDPACGDGELLLALTNALPATARRGLRVLGCDIDADAAMEATRRLETAGAMEIDIRCGDFLTRVSSEEEDLFDLGIEKNRPLEPRLDGVADLIISNPPYVRTQVLGARQAGSLARQFGLKGRIDLYHAFVIAMTRALRPYGSLGLLTSNRFLTTQAGASLRGWFMNEFNLQLLIDLGDTKLFEAAVLPAILIARREKMARAHKQCVFRRVYETTPASAPCSTHQTVLAALRSEYCGTVNVAGKSYHIETGVLRTASKPSVPWVLSCDKTEKWIETIDHNKGGVFADYGDVRVGIKTTADKVFVREDWDSLPPDQQPEAELLHPLITHHVAQRWSLASSECRMRRVLYPYIQSGERRQPINLADYPRARRYLESRRAILEGRQYIIEAGREWFEIWVPQSPSAWTTPKLAFPDISESNVFFLCPSGWVVNGDCYWISPKPHAHPEVLKAILAVANSSLALRYYDVMVHNKLYAGRRRFMSQYVAQFPLPKEARIPELAEAVTQLLNAKRQNNEKAALGLENDVDQLVWDSFGLVKKI